MEQNRTNVDLLGEASKRQTRQDLAEDCREKYSLKKQKTKTSLHFIQLEEALWGKVWSADCPNLSPTPSPHDPGKQTET